MLPNYTITPKFIERFWQKADCRRGHDACWPWLKAEAKGDYGKVRVGGGMHLAHRVAYLIANGTLPDDLLVCHKCDYPPCVNPRHLWLGTHEDNVGDMHQKGRGAETPRLRGEANNKAKLTAANVRAIRLSYANGHSPSLIAAVYGVTYANVWSIVTRRTWKHIN